MARALLKFIRVSPIKSRLIAREVQGMNAEEALAALEFTPNKAAKIIAKVIASAVANAENNFQYDIDNLIVKEAYCGKQIANAGSEPEDCVITSCRVDNGPVLKRFRPRARGMASGIRKPTAHILVEVEGK